MNRRTILVLAYSISPTRGSEYAVGWNYVTHMSRDNDLIVLYGLAGDHMGDIEEMRGAEARFGGRVTFVPVLPDRRARIANHLNRTGHVPFSFYLAYRYWHRSALAVARGIARERPIDVIHYLCPIGFREPGYLWKLGKPYIWGPVGGIASRPVRAFSDLGRSEGLKTRLRNAVNALQFRAPRIGRGLRKADVLLAATSENAAAIRQVYGLESIVVPENAIDPSQSRPRRSALPGDDPGSAPLRLVWIGTIETRKAITILLRALERIGRPGDWTLDAIGDGPLAGVAKQEAAMRGLGDAIRWHGKIARADAIALLGNADLHVLTSLAEANTTVLWEAMGSGVPTMAIDHCGMHDSICDRCGIRIPLTGIEAMSAAFARQIERLMDDRPALRRLSEGAEGCAVDHGWARRTDFWNRMFDQAIHNHRERG